MFPFLVWFATASAIDGTFIIAASYAGCNAMLVGLFFTIAVGAQGFHTASTMINPMDLSPNYAGTITGIANGISSCTGIIVPSIIGILTPKVRESLWKLIKQWWTICLYILCYSLSTVTGLRMAHRFLDHFSHTHCQNNRFHCMGIRKSSIMEWSRRCGESEWSREWCKQIGSTTTHMNQWRRRLPVSLHAKIVHKQGLGSVIVTGDKPIPPTHRDNINTNMHTHLLYIISVHELSNIWQFIKWGEEGGGGGCK